MLQILPILMIIPGFVTGVLAGVLLRPIAEEPDSAMLDLEREFKGHVTKEMSDAPKGAVEYVKFSNQFVVPIVKNGSVASLVVLALSLEVPAGQKEVVFRFEPKLRDSFLQVMFDHANTGGFDGVFTQTPRLDVLRIALHEVSQRDLGKVVVKDVLIHEIARQDY